MLRHGILKFGLAVAALVAISIPVLAAGLSGLLRSDRRAATARRRAAR
jgi:hypothetical protein